MKKAVFLNFPTHGCINGLLATAAELVARGHRLIYYCSDEFKPKIERIGAEFRSYQGLINDFKIPNYDLFKALQRSVDMTVDKLDHNLAAIQKENPDYIVHDSLCTWGKHMAAILRLPAVNLMHSFPVNRASMSLNTTTAPMLIRVGLYKLFSLFQNLPPNFIVRPSVPQQRLLEHVDLFITHAGMNSVNESICCGVPMLLLPHHFEQQLIANRVQELGMGVVRDIKKIKSPALLRSVHSILSDASYRNQALAYQSIFSQAEKVSHIKAADAIIGYLESRQ